MFFQLKCKLMLAAINCVASSSIAYRFVRRERQVFYAVSCYCSYGLSVLHLLELLEGVRIGAYGVLRHAVLRTSATTIAAKR